MHKRFKSLFSWIFLKNQTRTMIKISTIYIFFAYGTFMTDIYSTSSAVSPFTAILWCFYPVALLILVELFLGGGFDDDNDDQDGGMMIPAYSNVKN